MALPLIIVFFKGNITRHQSRNECSVSQHQLTKVATKNIAKTTHCKSND